MYHSMTELVIGDDLPVFHLESFCKTDAGIILLQEWWGVTDHMKMMARRIANYINAEILIPDLYRGKVAGGADEAKHLMDGLDWNKALQDVQECQKWLAMKGSARVVCIGFCMGGALSMAASARVCGLLGCVVFYGIPSADLIQPQECKVPLCLHFGNEDRSLGFSDPKTLDETVSKLNVEHMVWKYDGVGHAFMNEDRDTYKQDAAKQALLRTIDFIKRVARI